MLLENKVIAIDFDGTIVDEAYPHIGDIKPYAKTVIKLIKSAGHRIVLWTCREGDLLKSALEFLDREGIEFDAINENLKDRIELYGNDPRKLGFDYIIDDRDINWTVGVEWTHVYNQLVRKMLIHGEMDLNNLIDYTNKNVKDINPRNFESVKIDGMTRGYTSYGLYKTEHDEHILNVGNIFSEMNMLISLQFYNIVPPKMLSLK